MNQLAHQAETEIQQTADIEMNPALRLLQNAISSPDVPAERIDKALEWMERLEKKEAVAQFNIAFAAMQAKMPTVAKNGRGHQSAKYATLEDIIKTTKEALTEHGFGLNWTNTVDSQAKVITVTASLRHSAGHSIENVGIYPFDGSGSKNAIQSIGSAQTYGQRYTASALLGIATGDADDDGKAGGNAGISAKQAKELETLIETTGADKEKFLKLGGFSDVSDIPSGQFEAAKEMLLAAQRKRQEQNNG